MKKQEKHGKKKHISKIGWRTLLRGGLLLVINISRDWAYFIAGGVLIAHGHYCVSPHNWVKHMVLASYPLPLSF